MAEPGGTAPTVELQPTAWSQLLDSGNTTSSPGTASLKRAAGILRLVTCEVPSHPWLDPQLFPVLDDFFFLELSRKVYVVLVGPHPNDTFYQSPS